MMKRKILALLLLTCSLCFSPFVFAQSPPMYGEEGMAVVRSIRTVNSSRQTISSTYSLSRHTNHIQSNEEQTGQFYFSYPNLISFVSDQPKGDVYLLNKKNFLLVSLGHREREKLKNSPDLQNMQILLSRCFQGDLMDLGFGKMHAVVQEFPTGYKIKLTTMAYEKEHENDPVHQHVHEHAPLDTEASLSEDKHDLVPVDVHEEAKLSTKDVEKYFSVILFFNKDDLALKVVRLNENSGSYSIYQFFDPVFNQEIKAKVFKMRTYPKKKK